MAGVMRAGMLLGLVGCGAGALTAPLYEECSETVAFDVDGDGADDLVQHNVRDGDGRLVEQRVEVGDFTSVTPWGCDAAGCLFEVVVEQTDGIRRETLTTCDANNEPLSRSFRQTESDALVLATESIWTRRYGANGRTDALDVVSFDVPETYRTERSESYQYDAAGRLVEQRAFGDSGTPGAWQTWSWSEPFDVPLEYTLRAEDGTVLTTVTYTYDEEGREVQRVESGDDQTSRVETDWADGRYARTELRVFREDTLEARVRYADDGADPPLFIRAEEERFGDSGEGRSVLEQTFTCP
jgi:hypothetical protein